METARVSACNPNAFPTMGDAQWVQHGLALSPIVFQVAKPLKVLLTQWHLQHMHVYIYAFSIYLTSKVTEDLSYTHSTRLISVMQLNTMKVSKCVGPFKMPFLLFRGVGIVMEWIDIIHKLVISVTDTLLAKKISTC